MVNLKYEKVVGLNQWATDLVADLMPAEKQKAAGDYSFLRVRGEMVDVATDLTEVVSGTRKEEHAQYTGAAGDFCPLYRYTLRNGRVYHEVEQKGISWLDLPLVFLALIDERGRFVQDSLWSKEEAVRLGLL